MARKRKKPDSAAEALGWEHAIGASNRRFEDERDRRYTEVNIEREKALKIKEEADREALRLAREIQTYKDEKAGTLQSQFESERQGYATTADLSQAIDKVLEAVRPLADYVSAQQGGTKSTDKLAAYAISVGAVVVAAVAVVITLLQ